jgi:hypothetical protein
MFTNVPLMSALAICQQRRLRRSVLIGEFELTLWIKVLVAYVVIFTAASVRLVDTMLNAD